MSGAPGQRTPRGWRSGQLLLAFFLVLCAAPCSLPFDPQNGASGLGFDMAPKGGFATSPEGAAHSVTRRGAKLIFGFA
jgi:hypothetical protein